MRAHAQRECLDEKCEEVGMRRTVKVDIVELELLQRLIELLFHKFGLVRCVPELGGDEELLALHYRGDHLLQRAADLGADR